MVFCLAPSLNRTLRRLWTHLPPLPIWPSTPPQPDHLLQPTPGQPRPQTRDHPPRPHRRCYYCWQCLSQLEKEQITHLFRTFLHCPYSTRTLPPAIWPPYHESTRSPAASQLIPQHCPYDPTITSITGPLIRPCHRPIHAPHNSLFQMLPCWVK